MRLRIFCLAAILILFGMSANAQERKAGEEEPVAWAPICTQKELRDAFDVFWQVAESKNLVAGRPKPKIVFGIGRGMARAETRSDSIVFSASFFDIGCRDLFSFVNADAQRFIIAHEIGHYLLGHLDRGRSSHRRVHESLRDYRVRVECEADVFAAEFIGKGKALVLLLGQEFATRQTRKRKTLSLLLLPFFGPRDAIFSVAYRANLFRNPLGKYGRSFWIHGPAGYRALDVLGGRVKSCGCDEKPAAAK